MMSSATSVQKKTPAEAPTAGVQQWNRSDWLETALETADAALARHDLVREGTPELLRRWGVSAVLRIPTNRAPVWFKAVPPLFAHEGRIARWVENAAPELGLRVLGCGDGWLLTEELPRSEGPSRGHFLEAVARVQLASVDHTRELARLGCPDRGSDQTLAGVEALTARTDLLAPDIVRTLESALPVLAATLGEVDGLGFPPTLVHGDIQEENAWWTGRTWAVIDWTDASIGHPFAELARPLMHASAKERSVASDRFARVWADGFSPESTREALRGAPVIGAAHQVVNYTSIVDGIGPRDGMLQLLHEWIRRLSAAASEKSADGR